MHNYLTESIERFTEIEDKPTYSTENSIMELKERVCLAT
jgi:hypothetical protein